MPLVVISGRPCVGKTVFSNSLKGYLERHYAEKQAPGGIVVLNDESLGINKREGYKNAASEKIARGTLKGAVERSCNGSTTVIVDSLNYIKGYRYELYCTIRSAASTHAVVHVGTNTALEEALEWNRHRRDGKEAAIEAHKGGDGKEAAIEAHKGGDGYEDDALADLWSRYETPDEKNRWDSPLFTCGDDELFELHQWLDKVKSESTALLTSKDGAMKESAASAGAGASGEAAPADSVASASSSDGTSFVSSSDTSTPYPASLESLFSAIGASLYNKAGLRPVASTILTPTAAPSYLHELDRITGGIVNHLTGMLALSVVGDILQVPGSSVPCVLHRKVPALELRRLKRLFDKNAATRPGSIPLENVPRSFIEFVNANLKG